MRQFSPFQEVTKIPLLFSAQAHSVPPQTTSRAERLSQDSRRAETLAQSKRCLSPEVLHGEGGTSQILFPFLCDARSSWKSSVTQINKRGIAEQGLLETDKLITERGISAAQKGKGGTPWGHSWTSPQCPRGISSRRGGGKEHPGP